MSKQVTFSFPIFNAMSVSGTNSYTSSASSIEYRDSLAMQFQWTGPLTGSFDVQGSLDYKPGLPQSESPLNAGTWTSITLSPTATVSSAISNYLINMYGVGFPWVRVVYTNSTASGTMTGYHFSKSFST